MAEMGGSDSVTISHDTTTRTLVLVGRTGNGKSATANSILGKRVFKSISKSSGVTTTTEMKSAMHGNRVINVIDTPGLFDVNFKKEAIDKEIVKCVNLAKDGFHAVLLVFSVRSRFSKEEESVLESLQSLFGSNITDYMIVVFTGEDQLDDEQTLEDYLGIGSECPQSLQKILETCKRRYVPFDNKTKDNAKKREQVEAVIDLVDKVVEENAGRPFTNDMFLKLKEAKEMKLRHQEQIASSQVRITELEEQIKQMQKSIVKQLKQMTDTMEKKLFEQESRRQLERLERETEKLRDGSLFGPCSVM